MPFGLCNAPATFQRCMLSIFSDMVERFLEVFMDDFSVFGDSFDQCLHHLTLNSAEMYREEFSLKLGEVSFYGKTRYCSRSHHFE